ncbi:MAG: ankyrin repeat domain-containing protein [Tannerella sp.]|jgi:ankyrin repeat protein|nr:ankyrin repeat domain-containing protein [Tannerella sp.]
MEVFDFSNKKVSLEELIDAAKNGNAALVCELLKKGANVNAADSDGWTALCLRHSTVIPKRWNSCRKRARIERCR